MDKKRRDFIKKIGAATLGYNVLSTAQAAPREFEGPSSSFDPEIVDLKNESYTKVLIVGSGYGSSVTALRLAEAGVSSIVIEMGRLWNKIGKDGKIFSHPTFPDERSMWLDTGTSGPIKSFYGFPARQEVPKGTGILDVMNFDGIDAYMGRGVGGGSLVNMAMLVRANQSNLQRILPSNEVSQFYNHYYPLAEKMLEANSISPEFFGRTNYYRYSRIAIKQFQKAGYDPALIPSGYDFDYMEKEARGEVPKSALDREAGYGNNYGKKSLDKTYLAKAFATGLVRLAPLTEVKSVIALNNGNYLLEYVQRDETTGDVLHSGNIECTYLFLGAGSLGTSEILLRSKQKNHLPLVPNEVGANWGNNSEVFVARNNTIIEPSGLCQSTIPAGACRAFDQDNEEVFIMHLPLPVPIPHWINWHIAITNANVKTSITFDPGSDSITLKWDKEQDQAITRKAKHIFDRVNRHNLTTYNKSLFGNSKGFSTQPAYHLLGGCTLNHATNEFGELKNYQNLFITDGALLPPFIGVNPALTITALAERNIERILEIVFR